MLRHRILQLLVAVMAAGAVGCGGGIEPGMPNTGYVPPGGLNELHSPPKDHKDPFLQKSSSAPKRAGKGAVDPFNK